MCAKKILILEDEAEVAELYLKSLTAKGYEITLAASGVEGLAHLRKMKPDLIMLDLNMPEMGGVEFYQQICGFGSKAPYPILVVTGRGDMESLFKDFNVQGFIVKPFGSQRLLNEIEIILGKDTPKNLGQKSVIIIDEDSNALDKIAKAFTEAGYNTTTAFSAVEGIERIMDNPPDLAMINLQLNDMPGDLVVFKLQQLVKTKYVNCVLYLKKNYEHQRVVMDRISTKKGVKALYEYGEASELLLAAADVFEHVETE
jgi:DNA-binding response OmpR family regulator